jgi:hypothetical protein
MTSVPPRGWLVAEVLVQFADPVVSPDGVAYIARACGAEAPDGLWHGWIEFLPVEGGSSVRTGRETTQPNRVDAEYWATGLTPVYLEGALQRALKPPSRPVAPDVMPPVFDGPAPESYAPRATESILNPFSVYRKGEALLRRQLAALSPWHLVNIIRAYGLSDLSTTALNELDAEALITIIVDSVRREAGVERANAGSPK